MSELEFEWDDANRAHLKRHRVDPEEFEQVVRNGVFDLDYESESGEGRYKSVGTTDAQRILVIVWTVRKERIRAITSYDAPTGVQAFFFESSGYPTS